MRLHRKVGLGCSGSAKEPAWDRVRVYLDGLEKGVIDAIGTTGMGRTTDGNAHHRLEGAISAAAVYGPQGPGHHVPIFLYSGANGDDRGVRRVARSKFFVIGHNHLDRLFRLLCQKHGDGEIHGVTFTAKVSSHVNRIDANLLFGNTCSLGHLFTNAERTLCGDPDIQTAIVIESYDTRVGLNVTVMSAGNSKSVLKNEVRILKAVFHVPLLPGDPC